MKQTFVLSILILCLSATGSFAQTGHGMMRHMESGEEHEHMMEHDVMMENIHQAVQDMSGTMHQMSEIMGKISGIGSDRDGMHDMADVMRTLCTEMNNMSEMMDRGMMTQEEREKMRDRMREIQKKMDDIR